MADAPMPSFRGQPSANTEVDGLVEVRGDPQRLVRAGKGSSMARANREIDQRCLDEDAMGWEISGDGRAPSCAQARAMAIRFESLSSKGASTDS